MFANIAMMLVAAVVLVVVQAEVYAMLEAGAYARKIDGSLSRKLKIFSARYEWASVVWHETSVEKPAYSVFWTLGVFLSMFFSMALMQEYGGVKVDLSLALMGSLLTAIGFFAGKYGSSFAAHRANVAEQQRAGTWHFA